MAALPPGPLAAALYAGEVAPDRALSVPANADVDQDGRFAARGYEVAGAGLLDWYVSE